MSALRSHPAAGLAVLSALLFFAYAGLTPRERATIRVTNDMIDAMVAHQEELIGRPLSAEEREQAVDTYVEEELLLREAFRQGLDVGDRRVRGALTAAAQYALTDPDLDPPEPTPQELSAFYQANRENYRRQEAITVEYVFFLTGSLTPEQEADVLAELRAGANSAAVGGGLGQTQTVRGVTRSSLSTSTGREYASAVFDQGLAVWEGPLRSSQGIYYNRILERRPSRMQSFEEVEHVVRQELIASHYSASVSEALTKIRRRYDIEIEDPGGAR